jgi:hypothetical protein
MGKDDERRQMKNRYKLHKAEDGIIWLSLQPLVEDLKERMDTPDTPEHVVEALHYVKTFIDALVHEGNNQQ